MKMSSVSAIREPQIQQVPIARKVVEALVEIPAKNNVILKNQSRHFQRAPDLQMRQGTAAFTGRRRPHSRFDVAVELGIHRRVPLKYEIGCLNRTIDRLDPPRRYRGGTFKVAPSIAPPLQINAHHLLEEPLAFPSPTVRRDVGHPLCRSARPSPGSNGPQRPEKEGLSIVCFFFSAVAKADTVVAIPCELNTPHSGIFSTLDLVMTDEREGMELDQWLQEVPLPESAREAVLESAGSLDDVRLATAEDLEEVSSGWSRDAKLIFIGAAASLRFVGARETKQTVSPATPQHQFDDDATIARLQKKVDELQGSAATKDFVYRQMRKLNQNVAAVKQDVMRTCEAQIKHMFAQQTADVHRGTKRPRIEAGAGRTPKRTLSDTAWAKDRAASLRPLPAQRPAFVQFVRRNSTWSYRGPGIYEIYDTIGEVYDAAIRHQQRRSSAPRAILDDDDDDDDDESIESATSMDELSGPKASGYRRPGLSDTMWARHRMMSSLDLPEKRPIGLSYREDLNKWRVEIQSKWASYPSLDAAYTALYQATS